MTHARLLLLAAAATVLAMPAAATQPGAPDAATSGLRPAPPPHQAPQPVQLTDDQKARMKTLREEHQTLARPLQTAYRNQIESLRSATEQHAPPADLAARRAAVTQAREALRAENERFRQAMLTVLTPAQREQVARRGPPATGVRPK